VSVLFVYFTALLLLAEWQQQLSPKKKVKGAIC